MRKYRGVLGKGLAFVKLQGSSEGHHQQSAERSYETVAAGHIARPVMSTAAGLHHDRRRKLFSHEPAKLLPRQLPPELDLSGHGSSVGLKNILGQINPDVVSLVMLAFLSNHWLNPTIFQQNASGG
ncbi:hypothetical protein LP7551_03287 [Roseibium album]|nr:hypothetical protein LP7551_03287 [Roseibium album]